LNLPLQFLCSHFYLVFCLTDMSENAFIFPKESDNSYVSLEAQLKKPLKAFTVCLQIYTELSMTHGYSIFSYAMKKQPNEILIFWSKGRGYIFGVGGPEVLFKVPEITTAPVHICASWESVTGIVEFWLNGKPLTEASIILGHEQDSFGGGFDANQSLVGNIGNVNMWDFVLSPEESNTIYVGETFSPNVLKWRSLIYEAHGDVFTKPQLWP
uniref:Pentraxin family member n=1 Tax=Castor canadensis TaxID=51338 RepID=A0A8C0ZRL1_CASCN